jgi:hypothetical protein
MTQPSLTVLNHYNLSGSAADFTTTITALAARVKAEGDPGVLSYRFYVATHTARAVIDYASPTRGSAITTSPWLGRKCRRCTGSPALPM